MADLPIELVEDDDIILRAQASTAVHLDLRARVQRGKRIDTVSLPFDPTTDRAQYNTSTNLGGGTLLSVRVSESTGLKRGQCYVSVDIRRRTKQDVSEVKLCSGYVYTSNPLSDGEFKEAGPGGGEGFLSWVELFHDRAGNSNAAVAIAATNALRKMYGFVLMYESSGDAATRLVRPELAWDSSAGPPAPTNFDSDPVLWRFGALTLTLNEQGLIYVNSLDGRYGYGILNDAGTDTVQSSNIPFPLWIDETTPPYIFTPAVGSGHANDTMSAYALMMEWLVL